MLKEDLKPPTLNLPPEVITPEELKRRRKLFKELDKLREKMGPLDLDTTELIREIRGEWAGK